VIQVRPGRVEVVNRAELREHAAWRLDIPLEQVGRRWRGTSGREVAGSQDCQTDCREG
jgi:hypothetical protein